MQIIKAFACIGALVDNTAATVAPVGELSDRSRTFTKEKTEHTHSDYPDITLVSFSAMNGTAAMSVTSAMAQSCLKAVAWIYSQAKLGNLGSDIASFQQKFIADQGSTFDLVGAGDMVQFGGKYYAPSWINIAPAGQSANANYRIWLSDTAFANQFDEYTIVIDPPVSDLNLFFNDTTTVKAALANLTLAGQIASLVKKRGVYSETTIRADVFTWVDRNDSASTLDVTWPTLVYGAAGDSLDVVKEEIREYILANSTHSREEWSKVFPDLFTSTEFIISPLWDKIAVPDRTQTTGVYSSIANLQDVLTLAKATAKGTGYTDAHVTAVVEVVPSVYNCLMLAIVGGPENRGGIDQFSERYADYLAIATTHVDFGKMATETRKFVVLLAQMLMEAETLTPNTGVPSGFNRVTRDGIVYLATSFEKFQYLVATKYSVLKLATTES